ncbi:hypothetical protein MKS88_005613 [Plasmodium brasilianum]|uniref:Uncharacterized protein n=2 Tax=Plasmodium (Plasmodium) TaxID=418103 RepID=A0A1A8WFK7_PLAMA|nr:conserved Plasmodium protein, unknown function [Plasmodium malariae]KAI4834933.1 hypothetical protein MKS88_005613 [Plasmodium brasilianum]SBS90853.1 hypothetical protein, conserved [Plasmodium malariae]SCP03503.1 conserved Plasmodium protein, unknown function [Plasmodium malariae]
MIEDTIDFIFTVILDAEIYICIFVLLTYLTTKKINKLIKSDIFQNDKLLNRLSKHFYLVDVKAYFSPFKYMFKSIIYHIYYFVTVLFLIYLFRLYVSSKKLIQNHALSFFNVINGDSLTSDDIDLFSSDEETSSSLIVAFLFGVFTSYIFYKNISRIFRGKEKNISIHKHNLLIYFFELAKYNFREYIKTKPKNKKGTRFRFNVDTDVNPHEAAINNNVKAKQRESGKKNDNNTNVIVVKPRRNPLFDMFRIVYFHNHVLNNEKLLYNNHINSTVEDEKKNEKSRNSLLFILLKILWTILLNISNENSNKKTSVQQNNNSKDTQVNSKQMGKSADEMTPTADQAKFEQLEESKEDMKQNNNNVNAKKMEKREESVEQNNDNVIVEQVEKREVNVKQNNDNENTEQQEKREESVEQNYDNVIVEQVEKREVNVEQNNDNENTEQQEKSEENLKQNNDNTNVEQMEKIEGSKQQSKEEKGVKATEQKSNDDNILVSENLDELIKEMIMKGRKLIGENKEELKNAKNENIKKNVKSDKQDNNIIKLCDFNIKTYEVYTCKSRFEFKSIIEVLMLHVPIYFFFKNKLYVKTFFTLAMYLLNLMVWNFITFVSMIKPNLFVYYYVFNEHISQILSESISENEKNLILHFFYGFFCASIIYLKYHFNMEFKLIKMDDMNHFRALINKCLNETHKLKLKKIIKNYEYLKIFPLVLDQKNKRIYIEQSLLRSAEELEQVYKKRKLKNTKMYLQNIKHIVKYCDEDTANELVRTLKFVLLNELPRKVALNLSFRLCNEIYDKMKINNNLIPQSTSEHPSDCMCASLKNSIMHNLMKCAEDIKSNESASKNTNECANGYTNDYASGNTNECASVNMTEENTKIMDQTKTE